MSADVKTFQHQFTEFWDGHTGLTFGVTDLLHAEETEFQKLMVVETDTFGRLMLLDGLVMLTERDEFVYHEMISHPALCLHADPRRVLIVGGGDGGTAREVLRHASVEHVDMVEIDGAVVAASRRFFPTVASALDDSRLNVRIEDGLAFVKNAPAGAYDLVLVDSTDPVGFAEGLFGKDFYQDCVRILADDGILVSQTESPFDAAFQRQISRAHGLLSGLFAHVAFYLAHIPTYPMGTWSFVMASKAKHPRADFDVDTARARLAPFLGEMRYYNADLHAGAFALPTFVQRLF